MKYYFVSFELVRDNDYEYRLNAVTKDIISYVHSEKLLDNSYFISSFQDMGTVLKNVSQNLNDQDKMIIAQVDNITGKRIPNV